MFFTYFGDHSTKGYVIRNASARKHLRWRNDLVPSHEVVVSSCSVAVFEARGSTDYDGTLIDEVLSGAAPAYP